MSRSRLLNHSLLCLALLAVSAISVASEAARPRILIICVDAIPYSVVTELTKPALGKKALFKKLKGPTALIETFPSDSYVAWFGLLEPLGVKRSDGYEARHFSNKHLEVLGGYSLIETEAPWKDFFDWRLEGVITGAIAYGRPRQYALKEVDQGFAAFLASDKREFAMYVLSTDGIGHVYGPAAQADFLRELDRKLMRLHTDHPDMPFYTLIFSDHGMAGGEPLKNTWPDIKAVIASAGFNIADRLHGEHDVAFVAFGLLTSFEAYTWPGKEEQVATIVSSVPGVDLCVTRGHNGWKVTSARGDAGIKHRSIDGRREWSYRPLSGDPLAYRPVVERLRKRTGDPHANWFPDEWWFEATKDHFYPDALYRLAHSFDVVKNPASVVCSISPGYMYGSLLTEYAAIPTIGRLRWTHGALHRDATLGFMMSDLPGWKPPSAVRFNQALAPLARLLKPEATTTVVSIPTAKP